jgi:hypothetical protein
VRPQTSIRVIDKATGEYLTSEYKSFEEFAVQYGEITQRILALQRPKDKMSRELKAMMRDERELPLANGWHFA